MRTRAAFYPHPVLRPGFDDYVGVEFACELGATRTDNLYCLRVEFATTSKTLGTLVEACDAAFALHVECPLTRYRRLVESDSASMALSLDAGDLRGPVELSTFIFALSPLSGFSPPELHEDFLGETFSIDPGDVLAVGPSFFLIEDPDGGPRPRSIITIGRNEARNPPPLDFKAPSDKVAILLQPEGYARYLEFKGAPVVRQHLHAMIVIPVLTELIDEVRADLKRGGDEPDKEARKWYRSLRERVENAADTTTSVALAQDIIGQPLKEALATMGDMAPGRGDEDV
ncbi:MAG: hypothetical protein ACYCO4_01790 [Sulfobacillus sp.]